MNAGMAPGRRFLTCLMCGTVIACGSTASRRGDTVIYASGADLQSINPLLTVHPLARQVQKYALLVTLARYDSSLTLQPYLARRWDWSPDRRTLTLHLFAHLKWHDGMPTTAADVVWTLNAARDSATGYPRLNDFGSLVAARAVDDSTVVLSFSRRVKRFPDVLTDLAILPKHLLDSIPADRLRQAEWNVKPVGNGPFRFVLHEPHRRWVFGTNPEFPAELGGPPRINRLVIAVVDEPTTKLAALTSGELDFAGISAAHVSFVKRDPELAVLDYPLLFTYAIIFNARNPPFDDLNVRRAVSLALDRFEIVAGYTYGFSTPAGGPIPPMLDDGGPASPPPPDIEAARALLGERRIGFELLTVGSGEAPLEQMVQAELADAGFDVTIRQLELATYLDRLYGARHDFQAAVAGVPGDLGLGHLTPLVSVTGFRTPESLTEALEILRDSVPVAFLYHARGVQGMNRRVKGVRMDLRGELVDVAEWWVDTLAHGGTPP